MTKNEPMKNIWQEKKIAPLEYCLLDRAANLLGCEIEDFYHWYAIGAIDFAVDIGFVGVSKVCFQCEDDILPLIKNDKWAFKVDKSISDFSILDGKTEDYKKTINGYEWRKTDTNIFGIWKVENIARDNIKNNELKASDLYAIQKRNSNIKIKNAEPYDFIDIPKDSILVIREDIENIHAHSISGIPLPSYITGDIPLPEKENIPKTNFSATQSGAIYTLLQILYGEDVNKLSRENIYDLIAQTCAQKGIPQPSFSPKSLENWMRKANGKL